MTVRGPGEELVAGRFVAFPGRFFALLFLERRDFRGFFARELASGGIFSGRFAPAVTAFARTLLTARLGGSPATPGAPFPADPAVFGLAFFGSALHGRGTFLREFGLQRGFTLLRRFGLLLGFRFDAFFGGAAAVFAAAAAFGLW